MLEVSSPNNRIPKSAVAGQLGEKKLHILLDSGNLTSTGACISQKFVEENKIPYATVKRKQIGTAHVDGKLTIVGCLRNLEIKMGHIEVTLPLVWVIQGLNGQMNLGSRFLRMRRAVLDFKDNLLKFPGRKGAVPLIQHLCDGVPNSEKENHRPECAAQSQKENPRPECAAKEEPPSKIEVSCKNFEINCKNTEFESNGKTVYDKRFANDKVYENFVADKRFANDKVYENFVAKDKICKNFANSKSVNDRNYPNSENVSNINYSAVCNQTTNDKICGDFVNDSNCKDCVSNSNCKDCVSNSDCKDCVSNINCKKSVNMVNCKSLVCQKHCEDIDEVFHVKSLNNCTEMKNAKKVGNKTFFFPGKSAKAKNFGSEKNEKKFVKVENLNGSLSVLKCQSVPLKSESISVMKAKIASKTDKNFLILPNTFLGDEELQLIPGVYPAKRGEIQLLVANQKQFDVPVPETEIQAEEVVPKWMNKKEFDKLQSEEDVQEMHHIPGREKENSKKEGNLSREGQQETSGGYKSREELFKDLKLEENTLLKKHPKVKQRLKEMLWKYRDVFGTSTDVGETHLVTCKLQLKEGTIPVRQKERVLNPALEEDLYQQIQKWLKLKVIEPSRSPWSSPLVPVKKKDGSVRWATDLRKLNSCLVQDSYPLPKIQQLLDRAGGHRYYSSLDAVQAFFSIHVEEDSRPLTAFSTPWGLFQWLRMPFGVAVATQIYSRLIQIALNPLGSKGLGAYLDDVILFHQTLQAHLERLEEVLEQHREAGIKIKASKTELFKEKMTFLGHVLSKDGLQMVPQYVEKILSWPRPNTVKELNSLVGMLTYYSSFIPEFSKLMAPLNAQKKAKRIDWTEECEQNFQALKRKFQEAPIRSVPDFRSGKPFKITTDWSGTAIGAVLSQEQDGQERMIAAGGRKCTKGETRYPSWKGELCALVYSLRKYHHILSFAPFEVHTDASALKYLQTLKQTKGIVGRWLEEIQAYQFVVHHKPGKDNVVADALSRSTHMSEPTAEEEAESEEYLFKMDKMMEISRETIREHQAEDEILKEVRGWLSRGRPPTKQELQGKPAELRYWEKYLQNLEVSADGVLQAELPDRSAEVMRKRILVPQTLKKRIFEISHEHLSAGHFGVEATMARIHQNFIFFNMKTEVQNRIKICNECVAKEKQRSLKDGVHHSRRLGFPLELLYIDLVGPLCETAEGFKYVLSVEDGFSKFVNLYPLRSKETAEVTRVLVERFIGQYGCPAGIYSDNGLEFSSKIFNEMCQALRISKKNSVPYCPQSNQVERVHRTLNVFLRMSLETEDKNWDRNLPFFTLAYNSKRHSSTGVTPNLAFLGREANLPVDLMVKPPDEKQDVHQNIRNMLDRIRKMFKHIQSTGDAVVRRNASQYSGRKNPYQTEDLVWYLVPRRVPGKPAKICNSWMGPFRVVKRVSEVLLEITPAGFTGKKYTVHISRIREYHGKVTEEEAQKIPDNLEIDDEDDPEATEIRGTHSHSKVEMGIPVYVEASGGAAIQDAFPKNKKQEDSLEEKPMEEAPLKPVEDVVLPEQSADQTPLEADDSVSVENQSVVTAPSGQKRKLTTGNEGKRLEVEKKKPSRRAVRRTHEPSDSESATGRVTTRVLKKSARLLEASSTSEEEGTSTDSESMQVLKDLKVKIWLQEGAQLPMKKTEDAAGFDLHANEDKEIEPGEVQLIDTGVKMEMPTDLFAKLESRSSLAAKGIQTLGGVIDADYRGAVKVILKNLSSSPFQVKRGNRVAQMCFLPNLSIQIEETKLLGATKRGAEGFGSSGV